ncbi:MAG: rcc01693 family protein [Pseudomonadota bacterium]
MDWQGLIRSGLHGLRLTPAQFWALTPAELQIMLGVGQVNMPLGRAGLEGLLRNFPDTGKGVTDERDR